MAVESFVQKIKFKTMVMEALAHLEVHAHNHQECRAHWFLTIVSYKQRMSCVSGHNLLHASLSILYASTDH